jgi:hypothetical protein
MNCLGIEGFWDLLIGKKMCVIYELGIGNVHYNY